MAVQTTAIVVKNRKLGPLHYILEMDCAAVAETVRPGQFVMLRISGRSTPLLRRPFSVCKSYGGAHPRPEKRGRILILYKRVGKGTEIMTGWKKGERVDLIGPLGNGFTLPPHPDSDPVVLLGGGIGMASLFPLAEVIQSRSIQILIGGRSSEDILWPNRPARLKRNLMVATEDGSLGFKGTVLDLFDSLKEDLGRPESLHVYACGPMAMLRQLAERTKALQISSIQVCLESRMACGFGACWGCVVKTTDPSAPYRRVCREGPVFDLREIVWGEV
jgi:dihydroorotate dehydrogenase electron transfer subunit